MAYHPAIPPTAGTAYLSGSSNLVPGDTNNTLDVFVRDRQLATTERERGDERDGGGLYQLLASISGDGRYVVIRALPRTRRGRHNGRFDIFPRDRQNGTTERISVGTGVDASGQRLRLPQITPDGRFVVFQSASTLVTPDTNNLIDVFVRDLQLGTTEPRASPRAGRRRTRNASALIPLTPLGAHSLATNLVAWDTNGTWDVFVRDRQLGTTERASVAWAARRATEGATAVRSGDGSRPFTSEGRPSSAAIRTRDVFLRDWDTTGFQPSRTRRLWCDGRPCSMRGGPDAAATTGPHGGRGARCRGHGRSPRTASCRRAEKPTALSVLLRATATSSAACAARRALRRRLARASVRQAGRRRQHHGARRRREIRPSRSDRLRRGQDLAGQSRWYFVTTEIDRARRHGAQDLQHDADSAGDMGSRELRTISTHAPSFD